MKFLVPPFASEVRVRVRSNFRNGALAQISNYGIWRSKEPASAPDDLWIPRMRASARLTYRSIHPAAALMQLEPRNLKLAFLRDALESFSGALDAILIIGAI